VEVERERAVAQDGSFATDSRAWLEFVMEKGFQVMAQQMGGDLDGRDLDLKED
jgi:hypothetical protein